MYEYIKKTYYGSLYDLTALEENIHSIIYMFACFLIPFLMSHPQIVVGVVVNAALILGATYLRGHKMLPLIILPSLGVLAAGLIFGPFTPLLFYMIPFIWIGNAAYTYGYKFMMQKKSNRMLCVAIPSLLKAALLFLPALILVKLDVIPTLFLTSMGLIQLATALIGGAAAISIIKAKETISHSFL